jgi:hypothetical protein
MEEAILALSEEEAEWALALSDELFWSYMEDRQAPAGLEA